MAAFGSFIGWDPDSTTGNLTASAPVAPIFVERPNYDPLNLRLDLKSGELTVDGAQNSVHVTVLQEDKVSETPPVYVKQPVIKIAYVEDYRRANRLFDKFVPLPKVIGPKFDNKLPNQLRTDREE